MKRRSPRKPAAAEPATSRTAAQGDAVAAHVCERVRTMRKKKGWTLEQLATSSGVSRSMLSQIERGAANPTLGVAYRIARAFGISLADLVDTPTGQPAIEVVRADDPNALFRADDQVRIRTLSPLRTEKDVEFYEIALRPGGVLESAPHFEGTREILAVEKGQVRLRCGTETTDLHRGDSAHYPADVPHAIENIGRGEALAFLIDIYERRA
jgi:transcriptional regulator with XRE-family HTH domain